MQDKFFGDVAALIALLASDGRLTAAQADALYIENGKRQADAQVLADVRTLDEWQGSTGHYTCELRSDAFEVDERFSGATHEEARAKAAAWVLEHAKGAPPEPSPDPGVNWDRGNLGH